MSSDRITITLPSEVGADVRELARRLKLPVSTVVGQAIERQLRHYALGDALIAARRETGPSEPVVVETVRAAFDDAAVQGSRRRRTPRRPSVA